MEIISKCNELTIVALSHDEIEYLKGMPNSACDVILDYEHVPQRGVGADENRNDCGAACVAVCARPDVPSLTVDAVASAYMRPNQPMTIQEVQHALDEYGIANNYRRPLAVADIAAAIRQSHRPTIALVSYQSLPYRAIDYHGSHYVVIYGVLADGRFLYRDPLADGRVLPITVAELTRALQNVEDEGNLPNQGILLIQLPF